jgi:lysozyme family protein
MRPDDAAMIARVIRREGGYVDDPRDSGRCTCWGITRATLADWRGGPVSCGQVRALTVDEAMRIYEARYLRPWVAIADPRLRDLLFDSSVQHGSSRVASWLQQACDLEDDGVWRESLIADANAGPVSEIYRAVLRRRVVFYGDLISGKPSQAVFAGGWLRRVAEYVCLAALVLWPAVAGAQPVKNPRIVEFDTSADHAVIEFGVPVVARYELRLYAPGASAPITVSDLGKPAAGRVSFDRASVFALVPAVGDYEARVVAIGPGGEGPSEPVPFAAAVRVPAGVTGFVVR